jgi:glycosyl transferase family 87
MAWSTAMASRSGPTLPAFTPPVRSSSILSGPLYGLLAYKPQLALVMPFALLAGGQWRTVLAAGMTVWRWPDGADIGR